MGNGAWGMGNGLKLEALPDSQLPTPDSRYG